MKSSPANLNKARKEKARDRSRRDADANSAKYGQSKAQKELQARRVADLKAKLEQHRRERDAPDGS